MGHSGSVSISNKHSGGVIIPPNSIQEKHKEKTTHSQKGNPYSMHRPRPLSLSTHPSPAHLPSLNPYLENIRVALASLAVCCRKPLRGTSAPGSRRGLGDLPQLLRPPISVSSWAEPAWPDDSSSQKL